MNTHKKRKDLAVFIVYFAVILLIFRHFVIYSYRFILFSFSYVTRIWQIKRSQLCVVIHDHSVHSHSQLISRPPPIPGRTGLLAGGAPRVSTSNNSLWTIRVLHFGTFTQVNEQAAYLSEAVTPYVPANVPRRWTLPPPSPVPLYLAAADSISVHTADQWPPADKREGKQTDEVTNCRKPVRETGTVTHIFFQVWEKYFRLHVQQALHLCKVWTHIAHNNHCTPRTSPSTLACAVTPS